MKKKKKKKTNNVVRFVVMAPQHINITVERQRFFLSAGRGWSNA
jgi:hypothetical protein